MARHSVIMLFFAFFAFDTQIERVEAQVDCSTLISGSGLLVPEGTTCDLTSDINVNDVEILGQVISSTSPVQVTITCATFVIEAGGEVNLAGKGHLNGPGAGDSSSGGKDILFFYIVFMNLL